jgi:predicted nucleic-acid-binding protein
VIGVDTNVLLRAFLADDTAQAEAARALLEREALAAGPLLVNVIVLCELVWVLARRQRYSRQQIAVTIESLLATAAVQLDQHRLVLDALELFRASRADFADCLIVALNLRAGCSTTYSFDSDAAELQGCSPVPAVP